MVNYFFVAKKFRDGLTMDGMEIHGQAVTRENHAPGMKPRFMLRVGYVKNYPDPVSLRRPVDWFLT